MLDCDQKHSSRNRRRRFLIRFRRRFDRGLVKGIAGAKVELDRAECECIERALCEELKLRKDLPEAELEKHIARAVTSIAGAKSALERIDPLNPGLREIGRKKTDEELRGKLAPKVKALINTIDSLHKSAFDVLHHGGSQLGVVRSVLEAELKIICAVDLSAVPENPGRSFSAQPQRALSFVLAEVFVDLTGELPAPREKKRHGFRTYAHGMFQAMQMEPPSDRTLRDACDFVAKKQDKTPDFLAAKPV
jgi:hypothetical protein